MRANRSTACVLDAPAPRLGIVTTGKAYLDVRQALDDLGLDDEAARDARPPHLQGRHDLAARAEGARALRATAWRTCSWSRRSAASSRTSSRARSTTADASRRPRSSASIDESGAPLLPSDGELDARPWWRARSLARLRVLGEAIRSARQRLGAARRPSSRSPRRRRSKIAALAVLLLGLPAQHLDACARGSRAWRDRLPRHGAVDAGAQDRTRHPYGRRRRQLDRPGAVHRRSRTSSRTSATAPTSTSGLLAIRAAVAAA